MPRPREARALAILIFLGVCWPPAVAEAESARAGAAPREERLAAFLCPLQQALRWRRGRPWTPTDCRLVASVLVEEGRRGGVHDLLGLAVMIQESDLVHSASRHDGSGKTDLGLMGVRWPSRFTKGLKEAEVRRMDVNVRLGMAEIVYWRTAATGQLRVIAYRDAQGRPQHRAASQPCLHGPGGHEPIRHYNNGTRGSSDRFRAEYDARVGAIYTALADRFGDEPRDLVARTRYEPKPWDRRTTGIVRTVTTVSWPDPDEHPAFTEMLGSMAPSP